MALEAQRDDLVDGGAQADRRLDDAYHALVDARHQLDYAMRRLPHEVHRTLVSTAYDLGTQAQGLTEQLMRLRGVEPSER